MLNERFTRRDILKGGAIFTGGVATGVLADRYLPRALDYLAWSWGVSQETTRQRRYQDWVKELQESVFIPDVCIPGKKPIPLALKGRTTVWDLQRRFDAKQEDILELNPDISVASVLIPEELPHVLVPPTGKAVVENTSGLKFERRVQREAFAWSFAEKSAPDTAAHIQQRARHLERFIQSGFRPQTEGELEKRDLCIFSYYGYGEKLTRGNARRVLARYLWEFESNPAVVNAFVQMVPGTRAINDVVKRVTSPGQFKDGQVPALPESIFGEIIFIPNAPNLDDSDSEWGYLSYREPPLLSRLDGGLSYYNWRYPFIFGDYDQLQDSELKETDAQYLLTDDIWHQLTHSRIQSRSIDMDKTYDAYHVAMRALSLIGWETLSLDHTEMSEHKHAKSTLYVYEVLRKSGVDNAFEILVEAAATSNGRRLVEAYKKVNTLGISSEMPFYASLEVIARDMEGRILQNYHPSVIIEKFIEDYYIFLERTR